MCAQVLAGPYELTHKKKAGDSMTFTIHADNQLVTREFEGGKLRKETKKWCKDLEAAMGSLEKMIESHQADYDVREGEPEPPKRGGAPKQAPMLGKRASEK